MAFCFVHPTVASTGTCDDCKKPICTRCTKGTLEGFMCPPCAHKRYARRRLVTGLKVTGLVAVMLALALAGLMIIGKGSETTKAKALPPAEKDPLIAALRESRDQAPCDKVTIRRLTEELGKADRYVELVDDANRFFAKCGPFPRLEWKVVYALQQLGRYSEAVKHETVLVVDDPFDSDFWWWRGEDRARAGQPIEALADYRQSFANSSRADAAHFAADRILEVAGPADHPCEAVFALDFYAAVLGGDGDDDRDRRVRGLDLSARCNTRRGAGDVAIPTVEGDDGAVHVDATVNGVAGRFLLNSTCGTTALSTAFAQRAQVAPRPGATIDTVALAAVRSGPAGTAAIAIGEASAPAVEVVVLDGLPPELDGVIGLSYLWAFQQTPGDDKLELSSGHAPPSPP